MTTLEDPRPVGRIRFMDAQRVNLDGFAVENAELGLTALRSPRDPPPSLTVTDGRVTELDGVSEAEFDSTTPTSPGTASTSASRPR